MSNIAKAITIGAAALFTAGCAHMPGGISSSTVPLDGKAYDVVGEVKGTDSRILLLGILPISGANTTQGAVNDAKRKMNADGIIEVTVEAYNTWWILWSQNTTVVRGKAIKFK